MILLYTFPIVLWMYYLHSHKHVICSHLADLKCMRSSGCLVPTCRHACEPIQRWYHAVACPERQETYYWLTSLKFIFFLGFVHIKMICIAPVMVNGLDGVFIKRRN